MEAPGLSLFAGTALQLDTSQQRPEEDEAYQDQQRRNRELQHELENGFDDFIDDDEDEDDDSVNNSSKFNSRHISQPRLHSNKDSTSDSIYLNKYHNDNNDIDGKLKMLYEVRVQEVKRLNEELESCRREAAVTHDALYGRLAVANAEKDRAHISLQQSQEIVASSKHCIAELEHKVSVLSNKVETLQQHNSELNSEITATTASLVDAQKRLQFTKTNTHHTTDEMFSAQQERYKDDTQRLENELSRTRNKLTEKENELMMLEKRYIDAERMKEDLLVEKGSTINKLAMELEEAQKRLANNDVHELKDRLSHVTRERNMARLQVKEMANKLEETATELVETRSKFSKLQEETLELESTLEELTNGIESDSFMHLKGAKYGKKFLSHSDKIVVLRNELTKSMAMQKLEREQINKLTKVLQKREDLINALKKTEEDCKTEIDTFKEKETKYISNINYLQKQLELKESLARITSPYTRKDDSMKLDDDLRIKISPPLSMKSKRNSLDEEITSERKSLDINLVNENNKLSYQLKDALKQIDDLRNSYIEVCGAKDKLMREVDDLKSCDVYKSLEEERVNVEELLNHLKIEKLKVDDLGNKLLNQQLEDFQKQLNNLRKENDDSNSISNEEFEKIIDKLKDENNMLRETCDDQNNRLTIISMELKEAKQLITQLNSEIELQGQRDVLITELKEKAKQFEQYIMNYMSNKKNAATSPRSNDEYDAENSKENCINKQTDKSTVEKKIRQDLAQHFALEVKNIEEEHKKKLAEVENIFNTNVIQLSDVIKAKTKEVETLQDIILSERMQYQELLPKSKFENSDAHEKCNNKISHYEDIIQRLHTEINHVKSNGESDSALIDLNQKLLQTVEELDKLRKKYKTTKKNVSKYEEYIKNKNKIVKNEIEEMRIKYETSLSKMQERLNVHINQVGEQLKSRTKPDTNK